MFELIYEQLNMTKFSMQIVSDKVSDLLSNRKSAKILDVGCGDGLVGEALNLRGFVNIIGTDISQKMVQLAAKKNIYKEVFQADLMQPLQLDSKSFDALTCVGVTTYLEPRVIPEWCRVVAKGKVTILLHLLNICFRFLCHLHCQICCS